jgi:hypothetical protein
VTKRLRATIISSDLGGELFLYDGQDDSVHILNTSAGLVLEAYLQGRTADEIVQTLRQVYDVGPDRDLTAEVRQFIERIEQKKLICG